jgi:hypothetical protein
LEDSLHLEDVMVFGLQIAKKMMIDACNKSCYGILPWTIDGPQMDEANRQLNSTVVHLARQLKTGTTYFNNPSISTV